MARRWIAGAVLALGAIALAACGGSDDGGSTTPAASSAAPAASAPAASTAASAAFPVTIRHAFGETTIAAAPQRIATWGWGSADAAIALGAVPVAIPFQS